MSPEVPWRWILWGLAVVIALSSLVSLAIARRQELREKLDNYLREQVNTIRHKRKILAEHQRRAELVKKMAEQQAADNSTS